MSEFSLKKNYIKNVRYKKVYTMRFHLYKEEKQAKQMHDVKSPDSCFLCRERRVQQLDLGNILILDLNSAYLKVFLLRSLVQLYIYNLCKYMLYLQHIYLVYVILQ